MFSEFHENQGAPRCNGAGWPLSLSKIPKLQVVSAAVFISVIYVIFYVYIYIFNLSMYTSSKLNYQGSIEVGKVSLWVKQVSLGTRDMDHTILNESS